MSQVWRIVNLDQTFTTPIENTFKSTYAALKKAPKNEREQQRLIERWDECAKFAQKLVDLAHATDDPLSALTPACEADGRSIPGYYVLRHKGWSAYYRVDPVAHLCTGVLTRHESEGPLSTLQTVLKDL